MGIEQLMKMDIEQLIPHRGGMKLIGEIVEIADMRCVTASVASPDWPLAADGMVNSIILIELIAQTAGAHFGWDELNKGKSTAGQAGWIVGIKESRFTWGRIPVHSKIITSIEEKNRLGTYSEIAGTAMIDSTIVAEIVLQVFRTEAE